MTLLRSFILVAFIASTGMALAQSNLDRARSAVEVADYLEAVAFIRPAIKEDPDNEEALSLATKIYTELELLDTAKIYGKRLYEKDDDNPENVRRYAFALTRGKEAPLASEILRKSYKKSKDVETALYLVNALVEADSLQAAELVATTAKKDYPNSADAYMALGVLYYKYKPQPVLELAVQNFEKAIAIKDDLVLAHFALAECYWKQANRESDNDLANELFKRSLTEWNKVGQLDPRNARAWFEQGKIFFLAKKYGDAAKALTRYRELRPIGTGEAIASWYLGNAFFELNMCDSAKIHLDAAASMIDSLKGQASLKLARCLFLSKNWQGAATGYRTAYAAANTTSQWEPADVWYFGAALVLVGDTAAGINAMSEAAARDPKQCTFMFRFGNLLQQRRSYARSTEIFRQRLANCSDSLDSRLYMLIGNNFFADSLVDSAIAQYELSLQKEPENGFVLTRLAETSQIKGDEPRARALYGQVIAKASMEGAKKEDISAGMSASLKLNSLDYAAKNWAQIVERSTTMLKLDPANKGLMLYSAIGYQGLGNKDSACKWYKELLKLDPANEAAKKNMAALGC
ncbi:MAG: hypothetical protein EHM43_03650 [Ignavibacteriae bacterium]|nr:MAG: hypothetical protein EHM43_03650 [Ignavibacteriota bacterium]